MPYKKSPASFMKHESKAVGYMAKGSAAHMDSAVKKTNLDEFGNPIPKDFKADAAGVTGTVRKVTSEPIAFGDHGYGIGNPQVRDVEGKIIKEAGRDLRDMQDPKAYRPNYKGLIPSEELKGKKYITTSIDNRGIGQMSPYKMHGDPKTPHADSTDGKKEYDKKERGNVLRNVIDSLQTVEQQGELAAAKKYGNFTRAISEGNLPSITRGNTRGRSVSTSDVGYLDTNKSPYGKGLPTDGSESTSTTKVFQEQQNEMAKKKPKTFPSLRDAVRGTFQGYRNW